MLAEQDTDSEADAAVTAARRRVADADRKLASYKTTLDAGGDAAIAGWTRQATAERATAQAVIGACRPRQQVTEMELRAMLATLGNLANALHDADRHAKKTCTGASA